MRLWRKKHRNLKLWITVTERRICSSSSPLNQLLSVKDQPDKKKTKSVSLLLSDIRACIGLKDLNRAKSVHEEVVECGEFHNLYVANNLLNMYIKCGSVEDAQSVFNDMKHRDVVSWNSLMAAYAENGEGALVLDLFSRMTTTCLPSVRSFVAAFQACANLAEKEDGSLVVDCKLVKVKALDLGRSLHAQALSSPCGWDIFLSTTLVDMYSKCGSMTDAYNVFIKMPFHNVICWTALMLGYNENGEELVALDLFHRINPSDANSRTFVAALKACTSLAVKEEGRPVNGKVIKVDSLKKGVDLHREATERGFASDMFLASTLVDMYSKCGSTSDARKVFDRMPKHDLISWTGMLLGYAENGEEELALKFFFTRPGDGFFPDSVACVAALRACIGLGMKEEFQEVNGRLVKVAALEKGGEVHAEAARSRCELDPFVASTLVELYSKCGVLEDVQRIYERVAFKDVTLWNSLMMAYADNGEGQVALDAFVFLKPEGCSPNNTSFVAAVKACTCLAGKEEPRRTADGKLVKLESLEKGMIVHNKALKYGYDTDLFVGNTLVDMYSKCGSLLDARITFDRMAAFNAVSWNGLVLGYADNGEQELAVELFTCMELQGGCQPIPLSFVVALKACTSLADEEKGYHLEADQVVKVKALEKGMRVHFQATKHGNELEAFVGNTLVDFYAKCGSMVDARLMFDSMDSHSVITWTALLLGYVDNREPELALEIFRCMQAEGCLPDVLSYVAVLKACGGLADVEVTKAVHGEICRREHNLEKIPLLVTSLLDVYGKCGNVRLARQVFDMLPSPDRVTWTALLAGYSREGDVERVIALYREMLAGGMQPNDVTCVCVLTACSHTGLVEEGKGYFREMVSRYGVSPGVDHYVCMVDMLGRANRLEEAVELVKGMECGVEANALVWKALLSACKLWKNEVVGRLAFESLIKITDKDPAAYVLMASIYESKSMVEERLTVEALARLNV